ncbi:MAG: APC family permease [Candidatus Tyrphobacter sp.]
MSSDAPDCAAGNSLDALGYKQELKRSLTLGGLFVYGLVLVVPIAPIAVFGIVFDASRGMVPLVYAIGLVAMLFTALSYMAMVREFPVAGSVYSYAARSLGPTVGFFAGWAILLDYLLVPTVTYVACAIAVHAALPSVPQAVWVVVLLGLATTVNYYGISTTARISLIMLALQIVILAIFFAVAIPALIHHVDGARLSLTPLYDRSQLTPPIVFGALSLAVVSFLGFDAISTLTEESRGGWAPVARATMLTLCASALLFMLQAYVASLFVLGRTSFAPGDPSNAAFYNIAASIGGYWLKTLLAIPGVVFSAFASAVTAQAATARLLFGMARDGKLPRALAHVSETSKVPDRSIFLVAGVTLVLGLLMVSQFELLTSMVSFGALVGFLLLHASVVVHFVWRRKSRNWLRHLVAPAVGFCIIAYVLWNAQANAKIAGVCWLSAGVLVLVALRRRSGAAALPVE